MIFKPKKILRILDLWSIGYYKIKHAVLQQNLSNYFRFESANVTYEQFNKFINILKKEKEETNDKNPWLHKDGERRNMSDQDISEKYVDLEKSYLSETKMKELMDMLYKY